MADSPLIQINSNKCVKCYACVKACPVKAIMVSEPDTVPKLSKMRCIGCGSCISSCSPKAIDYRSSVTECLKILRNHSNYSVAIISPGISGEFEDITDYRKFVQMIRAVGFSNVHEVAFGVDLIAKAYQDFTNDFKGRYYISSYDPVVVQYIEKFKPNLVNNLIPLLSPAMAMGKVVRELHNKHNSLKVVYFGADICTKEEILREGNKGIIDCALTFNELRKLFSIFEVNENTLEFSDFDPPLGYKGSLYPLANGILQAADADENLLTTNFITVQGEKNMIAALNEFENGIDQIERHLNVNYGNALMGPGMSGNGKKLIREHLVINYANKRLLNFFRIEWLNAIEKYEHLDFSASFITNDQRLEKPSEKKVKEVLKSLGKTEKDNLGCGECGYTSCKHFAIAIAQGIASKEMCSAYAMKNHLERLNSLKKTNAELAKTQQALKASERLAHKEQESAKLASSLTSAMLQKLRAGVIIVNKELKILQSNKSFIEILGDEAMELNEVVPGLVNADLTKLVPFNLYNLFTYVLENSIDIENRDVTIEDKILNISIFEIQKEQVVGAIVRDMSTPEVQKFEVMNRISEAIDKNLEMVQQIGYLLGEGASDIEKMLNSVIEFYQKDK